MSAITQEPTTAQAALALRWVKYVNRGPFSNTEWVLLAHIGVLGFTRIAHISKQRRGSVYKASAIADANTMRHEWGEFQSIGKARKWAESHIDSISIGLFNCDSVTFEKEAAR